MALSAGTISTTELKNFGSSRRSQVSALKLIRSRNAIKGRPRLDSKSNKHMGVLLHFLLKPVCIHQVVFQEMLYGSIIPLCGGFGCSRFHESSLRQIQSQPFSLVEPSSQGSKLWSTAREFPNSMVTKPMWSPNMHRFSYICWIVGNVLRPWSPFCLGSIPVFRHVPHPNLQMPLLPCSSSTPARRKIGSRSSRTVWCWRAGSFVNSWKNWTPNMMMKMPVSVSLRAS